MQFKEVNDKFRVIDSDMVTAIIDEALAKQIAYGEGDWCLLQGKGVSIRRSKVEKWHLKEIADGLYQWTLGYDSFFGYMNGVLEERA